MKSPSLFFSLFHFCPSGAADVKSPYFYSTPEAVRKVAGLMSDPRQGENFSDTSELMKHRGPSIYDVRKILGFFDTPLVRIWD